MGGWVSPDPPPPGAVGFGPKLFYVVVVKKALCFVHIFLGSPGTPPNRDGWVPPRTPGFKTKRAPDHVAVLPTVCLWVCVGVWSRGCPCGDAPPPFLSRSVSR